MDTSEGRPLTGRGPVQHSDYRYPAAAAAVVAAAAHAPVTGEHVTETPYLGSAFVALEASCAVLAVLLIVRERRWVWRSAVLVGAAAVAAYVLSRSVGLPQAGDDVGDWGNPLGLVAVASELVLAGVATAALLVHGPGRAVSRRWPAPVAALSLLLGMSATAVAAGAAQERPCPQAPAWRGWPACPRGREAPTGPASVAAGSSPTA
jgi:hypothetical protein